MADNPAARFKIGDRVEYLGGEVLPVDIGTIGTVNEDNDDFPWVKWDTSNIGGSYKLFACHEEYLRAVTEPIARSLAKGDKVRIIQRKPGNTTGGQNYSKPNGDVGKYGVVKVVIETTNQPYGIWSLDGDYLGWFDSDDLELLTTDKPVFTGLETTDKEHESMSTMKKLYRLTKDTPTLEAGAILEAYGSSYRSIETIWDTEAGAKYRKDNGDLTVSGVIVENSPEWFEEIYESTLGKVKYVTKEAAKAGYEAIFSAKKK